MQPNLQDVYARIAALDPDLTHDRRSRKVEHVKRERVPREKHPVNRREYMCRYRDAHRAYFSEWAQENKLARAAYKQKWREANREQVNASQREYRARKALK
jgi:hypothetical protein